MPRRRRDAAGRITGVARAELEVRDQISLYADIEVPLAVVLAKIERAGIALDPAALTELSARVNADVERLQSEIYAAAGEEFNIGSPQQLGRILFDKMGLPHGGKNKTGYATGVEVLQGIARDFPIAAQVLEYREVTKLKNTYIDVLPGLIDPRDNRLHTVLNQRRPRRAGSRQSIRICRIFRCAPNSAARSRAARLSRVRPTACYSPPITRRSNCA